MGNMMMNIGDGPLEVTGLDQLLFNQPPITARAVLLESLASNPELMLNIKRIGVNSGVTAVIQVAIHVPVELAREVVDEAAARFLAALKLDGALKQ
jgi:hypothetical protein